MGEFLAGVFVPVLAVSMGASVLLTSFIVVAYNLAVFLSSYIFGRAADIYGRRFFLQCGLGLSAIVFMVQVVPSTFHRDPYLLLVTMALAGISVGLYSPALMAFVVEEKKKLGRFMSWGAVGWGIGTLLAGVLASFLHIFVLSSLLFMASFAISLYLPKFKERLYIVPIFPVKVIRRNLDVYIAMTLRMVGATAFWWFFPVYMSVNMHIGLFWVGLMYTINAFTQFIVMNFLDSYKSIRMVHWGLALSATVFLVMGLITVLWQFLVLYIFVGVAWALLYVGSSKYVMARCDEKATASGLLNSTLSMAGVVGPFLGGMVSVSFGYRTNFFTAALLTIAGLYLLVHRGWGPGKR